MNRTYTTLHFFILFLGLYIMPAFPGAIISCAEEYQGKLSTLDGFAEHVTKENISPISICFAKAEGGDASWATLEWGKTMLGELERHLMVPANKRSESIEDILAFRDWCLGAPGGGNLALAISAEEVTVELLFKELAEKHVASEEIVGHFLRFSRNVMSADYWLETLLQENIEVKSETAEDKSVADYQRLEAIFSFVNKNCAGSWTGSYFPKTDWPREGSLATFNPYALVWRSMMLERRKVALETCFAIQASDGDLPVEREEFRLVAEKCADCILRNRERVTSWMTAYDVWNFWAKALKEAN